MYAFKFPIPAVWYLSRLIQTARPTQKFVCDQGVGQEVLRAMMSDRLRYLLVPRGSEVPSLVSTSLASPSHRIGLSGEEGT